jgi:Flp pilus assembly protein TadD
MARAAAKRRQPPPPPTQQRKKQSSAPKWEDQLFFNRIRNHAKWVFVFLALVFGLGFAFLGVGSSGSGLGDFFSSLYRSSGSGSSISKALKATEKQPKSPKAWSDLAQAYELKGNSDEAIGAWKRVTALQPHAVDPLSRLASLYEAKVTQETQDASLAQTEAQAVGGSPRQLPATSPLARALTAQPDLITQASSSAANQRFGDALTARQKTLGALADTYGKVAKLQPDDPAAQLQFATAAQNAGETAAAIAAYKLFVKLAPDDPNASYAKQQVKSLQAQPSGTPQG